MRLVVWLSAGGRSFIHVPSGKAQQGWHSFLKMLKGFQMKYEYSIWINTHPQGNTYYSGNPQRSSYADMLKSKHQYTSIASRFGEQNMEEDVRKSQQHSPVSTAEKQSSNLFWVQKNKEVFQEDFDNLWIFFLKRKLSLSLIK